MPPKAKRIRLESSRHLRSQVTRIGKLPDNVLEEVFSYLDAEELKSAALVCKKWDRVIGSAAMTMAKFKIVINDINFKEPIRSTRRHYNIEMDLSTYPATQKMKATLNRLIVSQARSFKFACYGMVNPKSFSAALARMTLLEDLHIGRILGLTKFSCADVNLPRLKEILLMGHETQILDDITASNVTKLHVLSTYSNALSASAGDHLTTFLKKCNKTIALWIDSNYAKCFFRIAWKDCDIKLSSLCVRSSVRPIGIANDSSFIENMKRFFITQAPTLTTLDISLEPQDGLPVDFFKQIFTLLRHLPRLEMLTLPCEIDDINKIATFNQKLSSLSVRSITKPLEAGLNMKNLMILNVESIPDAESWKSVTKNSPKLRWVTVSNEIGQDFKESMQVLMEHPDVQDLVISSHETNRLRQIFDLISSNYGNLESLNLKLGRYKKSMEFSFPADPTEWNKSEQKKRFEEMFPLDPVDE